MSEETTYSLPSWNMKKLEERIAKINKRATRMNVAPLELVKISEELRTDPEYFEAIAAGVMSLEEAPKVTYINVQIKGTAPKLAGWKFIGTLDHYSVPGQVIVQTVPGESVPAEFHNREAICDHCNKIRNRVETFVCESEQHEFKQVGRQCLRDFLGHDPSHLAWMLTAIHSLADELDDEKGEYYGGGMRQDYQHELLPVLTLAVGVIRTFGWVSRTAAMNGGSQATADVIRNIISPARSSEAYELSRKLREEIGSNDEDKKVAETAMAWVKEQTDTNEYMHNIKAIVESGHTSDKMLGYSCSIIAAYNKAMGNKNEYKNKLNEYVGTVGGKIELTVEVANINEIPGYYGGVTRIFKMHDESGRTLVWFCSGQTEMKMGGKYIVKGTVKKQEEYKEWKQTSLTRVKVLKDLSLVVDNKIDKAA